MTITFYLEVRIIFYLSNCCDSYSRPVEDLLPFVRGVGTRFPSLRPSVSCLVLVLRRSVRQKGHLEVLVTAGRRGVAPTLLLVSPSTRCPDPVLWVRGAGRAGIGMTCVLRPDCVFSVHTSKEAPHSVREEENKTPYPPCTPIPPRPPVRRMTD